MRIGNNVEMLEIGNEQGRMYPVLLWDDKDAVLIDTGLPGQLDLIRAACDEAGISADRITMVILTHHDMDHIGSAKILAGQGAKIVAHEAEAPYIEGTEMSPKLLKMENRINELTEGERAFLERVKAAAPNFHTHVDRPLKDGDELPVCGGIVAIHTPGHTPGHMSLLIKTENILVTGDAANISGGTLTGANPQHTLDMQTAGESFDKLKQTGAAAIVCYHGGILKTGK